MKNNTWYRLLAGLLCAVLLLTAAVPAWVLADEADSTQGADAAGETASDAAEDAESTAVEEIHIASAEDFADFIASCTLDTWSQRKRFVLDCDITLESADFVPAATFGGVFLGAGHTIRGLSITDSAAPTGLFCVLQEGASIRVRRVRSREKSRSMRLRSMLGSVLSMLTYILFLLAEIRP